MSRKGYKSVLWLKVRHLRTELVRHAYVTGSDLLEDNSASDRTYQAYIIGFVGVVIVVLWAFLLDQVRGALLALPSTIHFGVLQSFMLMPLFVLCFAAIYYLRSFPLKLAAPDISFLASSSLGQSSLFAVNAFWALITPLIVGFLVGYLLGVALESVLHVPTLVIALAFFGAVAAALVFLLAWIIGVLRLLMPPKKRVLYSVAVVVGISFIGGFVSLLTADYVAVGEIVLTAVVEGKFLFIVAGLALLVALLIFLLRGFAQKINMTSVIEENALHIELYPLRHMSLYDASGYEAIKRRVRLSAKKPKKTLVFKDGKRALLSRSVLSYCRQYWGMSAILVWSIVFVPVGVLLLLGFAHPTYYALWLGFLLIVPNGPKELTRVFKDDARNQMLYSHIPFNSLWIVILDSLFPFLVSSILSVVAVGIVSVVFGANLFWSIALAILLNCVLVLCGALDGVKPTPSRFRLSYEAGLIRFALVTGAAIFVDVAALIFGVGVLVLLGLAKAIASDY